MERNETNTQVTYETQNKGHQMITRSKAGIYKPKVYTNQTEVKPAETEPFIIEEALANNLWK